MLTNEQIDAGRKSELGLHLLSTLGHMGLQAEEEVKRLLHGAWEAMAGVHKDAEPKADREISDLKAQLADAEKEVAELRAENERLAPAGDKTPPPPGSYTRFPAQSSLTGTRAADPQRYDPWPGPLAAAGTPADMKPRTEDFVEDWQRDADLGRKGLTSPQPGSIMRDGSNAPAPDSSMPTDPPEPVNVAAPIPPPPPFPPSKPDNTK